MGWGRTWICVAFLLAIGLHAGDVHADPSSITADGHSVDLRYLIGSDSSGTILVLGGQARVWSRLLIDGELSRYESGTDGSVFGNPSIGVRMMVLDERCYGVWAGVRGTFSFYGTPDVLPNGIPPQTSESIETAPSIEMYQSFDRWNRYTSVRALAGFEQHYRGIRYIATLAVGHAYAADITPYELFTMGKTRSDRTFVEHAQDVSYVSALGPMIGARLTVFSTDLGFSRYGGQDSVSGTTLAGLGPYVGWAFAERPSLYARAGVQLGFGGPAAAVGDRPRLFSAELRTGIVF